MRRVGWWLAAAIVTAAAPLGAQEKDTAREPTQRCSGSLGGRVVDGRTGDAVASAEVELAGGPDDVRTIRTDRAGAFAFRGVCAGRVVVVVRRPDYQPARRTVQVPTARVDVALEPRQVDRLDDIVVEAPAPPVTDTRATATFDADALDRERGKDLAETLAQVPGVTALRGSAGSFGKPIVRGQYGRRLLILYDGVRHEGQKWGLDHAPEIDPFSAGSITVVKGAGTVRYGPDAIGGVVLIDPPPLRITPGVAGEATLVGVSNGLMGQAALRLEGAHELLPGFAWALDGNALKGAAPSTPDYPLDNAGSEQLSFGGTIGYATDLFDLKLTHRQLRREAGICACIRNDTPSDFFDANDRGRPLNADLYSSDYAIERPFQRVRHDLWLARASAQLGAAGRLSATYAYQVDDRQELDTVRSSITGPQADFLLTTHSVNVVHDHPAVDVTENVRWTGSVGLEHGRQEHIFQGLPLIPNYRGESYGAFVIERLAVPGWDFEAGLRYDWLGRDAFLTERAYGRLLNTSGIDDVACELTGQAARCDDGFEAPSATAGALWHISDRWSARLNVSSAIRFPNVDEQYLNGTAPTSPIFGVGNPSLGPERTTGSTLTGNFDSPWLSAEASVYANYTGDYIYLAPQILDDGTPGFEVLISGTYPRFVTRAVDALYYGGDGGFTLRPPSWPVEITGQVSIVRGRNLTDGAYLVFVPADRGQLGVKYLAPNLAGWEDGFVGVNVALVDRQRRFDEDADLVPPPPGYALLGASAGVERPLFGQRLLVSVEGRNLTNARYRDYTSLRRYFADEPGIEVLLRVGLKFGAGANDG